MIFQSIEIMQMELVENRQIASDVMIRPPVEKFGSKRLRILHEIIIIGEEAATKIDIIK